MIPCVTDLAASKKFDRGRYYRIFNCIAFFPKVFYAQVSPVTPLKKICKPRFESPSLSRGLPADLLSVQAVIPPEAADMDFSIWDEKDPCISM